MRLTAHLTALLAVGARDVRRVRKPDALRPGIVGTRGFMVSRLYGYE